MKGERVITQPASEILRRRDEIVRLTEGALAGVLGIKDTIANCGMYTPAEAAQMAVQSAIIAQKQIDAQEGEGF